ncbi:MAG: DUF4384 domain-containing protein [Lautropia sp.]
MKSAQRPRPRRSLRRALTPVLAAAALAGCSTVAVKGDADRRFEEARKGPAAAPYQSITSFSPALRCMDNMMIDYGVRDISMLVEDILDQTKKVNAGTRDMLISAMSEMTRRSRAVRVVAFGKDSGNIISFLDAAQRQSAYQTVPQFDIKGSVTQWDENVVKTQKDAGLGFQPFVNFGASGDAAASVLGLDLSMLTTEDMSVLPGVTSRNSVVIYKQGKGFDGDAAYKKFGISFSMTFNKSEGQSQALRGLVELATIELMGKLTKVPYWKCLGADPESDEIKLEQSDWYYAMATTPGNLVAYFQNQMRVRRFYDGPVDGNFNPAIDEAITNLRSRLGMSAEPAIEQGLFTAYLNADVRTLTPPEQPARFAEAAADPAANPAVADATTATPAAGAAGGAPGAAGGAPGSLPPGAPAGSQLVALDPLRLAVSAGGKRSFNRGELVDLQVATSRGAYVYCYLQDESRKVARIFPNRFASDGYVTADRPLQLPGDMRFQLVMNGKGVTETVACLATAGDVSAQLPREAFGTDFEPLPVASLDQIRRSFMRVTNGEFAQENFHVQPK